MFTNFWSAGPGQRAGHSPGLLGTPQYPKMEQLGPITHSNRSGNLLNLLKEYKHYIQIPHVAQDIINTRFWPF